MEFCLFILYMTFSLSKKKKKKVIYQKLLLSNSSSIWKCYYVLVLKLLNIHPKTEVGVGGENVKAIEFRIIN